MIPTPTGTNSTRCAGSTRGTSVVIVETSSMRSCNTRLCLKWWVRASGMPVLAAVKIAAAPGSRMGRLSRTQSVNSSSRWRRRRCLMLEQGIPGSPGQHQKRDELPANNSGNQPPSISFVAFADTKTRSIIKKQPFTAATRIG